MHKRFIINGRFMEDRMHGLVRYSRELVKELDRIIDNSIEVILVVPPTAKSLPTYIHINTFIIGSFGGLLWEQTYLRNYVKKHKKSVCINFCNVTPLFVQPGITAILDIMYKVNPSHYTSFRNRLSRFWHVFQYAYITRHEKKIITISDFCKDEIERHYPFVKGKIEVIPCAWQHVLKYKSNNDWHRRFPFLNKGEFFFSLATLSKNKNGKWIIEVAKRNKNFVFAIAGKHYETEYDEIPQNVHMLGYVSDEDACALIKNCKAFIFPSLYEGFGLPPLEALALGADVISSNTASLPEVLGNCVHYIDPKNSDVDINKILKESVGPSSNSLDKYSWELSASKLLNLLLTL